ncbi:flagellar protein FliT [Luminiphilus sp.]|nr:flagellar protein FliT [Luminiphilus sp.]MDA8678199.1 flagellar protein FliT [Luminiphilus sp.]
MTDTSTSLTLTQTRLLATVVNTTRNMLSLADDSQWDAVADLELLRREDLRQCFEIPVNGDQSELVSEALAVLLHLNEELTAKLSRAREHSAEQGAVLATKVEAMNEYHRMRLVR